jgi:hypothetical protein
MRQHQLSEVGEVWTCSVCLWRWRRRPISVCPGLPRYEFDDRPPDLLTRGELERRGLRLPAGRDIRAGVVYGDHPRTRERWTPLYDARQAVPAKTRTPAQLEALRRGAAARRERQKRARDGYQA